MVMGFGVALAPFATLETREVEEVVLVDCLEKGPLTEALPLRVEAGDEKEEGRLAKVLALAGVARLRVTFLRFLARAGSRRL